VNYLQIIRRIAMLCCNGKHHLCDRLLDLNGTVAVASFVELAVLENNLTLAVNGGGVGLLDMLRKL
jgi:hypothetical protein